MQEIVKIQHLKYEIDDHVLINEMNTHIRKGDVIGVIGKNGSGKSTLLQLIYQQLEPTAGKISFSKNHIKIQWVKQETKEYSLSELTPEEQALLNKWNVPKIAYSRLSGGEKLKARLARAFKEESELLLLDEPTNHLDEQSISLLTQQLKGFKGAIIVVSHDRFFLDEVATKIWSLENGAFIEHKGNYSSYMKVREEKRKSQQKAYEKQQKKVERIEEQMNQLSSWSQKAHSQSTKKEGFKEYYRVKAKRTDAQIKSKQKRLESELEKHKVDQVEPEYQVQFSMNANQKVGKRFLEVRDLEKSFDERLLFHQANFTIQHGEKVALLGPNGSGKTTFLKMLSGDSEKSGGEIWISPTTEIGYLTQEVFDLPIDQSPSTLFYRETFEERGHVQNLMKNLGFLAHQWTEPIEHLSMGERVKCKLMKYILEEKDVLILDEPTNHLDLVSREQLEQTLSGYNGTLIVVTHDRYFREKTTNTQLVFSNSTIKKQLHHDKPKQADQDTELEETLLKLETERQEVLGKLSFLSPNHKEYKELDQKFVELTITIKKLSQ
ncbi:ribosomal protection-like ABC-F family protein [Alkalihalobacillus trypoxylicola]|uniref:Ribosome protection protein VmlR n=1 Tax=Alkalihalobacillus trypoxylicola TaxID=519424 RepID=A0A162F065_9BACI|nr:ABC-F type ribosomal protection protein [Alkalihalobacillus trypoxylicola]KYG34151.1 elongation factor 3 [Alkalihalobacillus trypoxylicola]